jgi:hypothetical protein
LRLKDSKIRTLLGRPAKPKGGPVSFAIRSGKKQGSGSA